MLPGLGGLVVMRTLTSTFRPFFRLSNISRIGFLQSCIDTPSTEGVDAAVVVGEGLLRSDERVRGGVRDRGGSLKHHMPVLSGS